VIFRSNWGSDVHKHIRLKKTGHETAIVLKLDDDDTGGGGCDATSESSNRNLSVDHLEPISSDSPSVFDPNLSLMAYLQPSQAYLHFLQLAREGLVLNGKATLAPPSDDHENDAGFTGNGYGDAGHLEVSLFLYIIYLILQYIL